MAVALQGSSPRVLLRGMGGQALWGAGVLIAAWSSMRKTLAIAYHSSLPKDPDRSHAHSEDSCPNLGRALRSTGRGVACGGDPCLGTEATQHVPR